MCVRLFPPAETPNLGLWLHARLLGTHREWAEPQGPASPGTSLTSLMACLTSCALYALDSGRVWPPLFCSHL